MERYQRGHQQPVEGERPIGVLLVFACLTVAIAAVLWGLNAARRAGTDGRVAALVERAASHGVASTSVIDAAAAAKDIALY